MRKRIHQRRVNREHWIKKMRKSNPLCLGNQPEERAVTIKTPRPPSRHNFDTRLVVTIEKLISNAAGRIFVREFERLGAEPLRVNRAHNYIGQYAFNRG